MPYNKNFFQGFQFYSWLIATSTYFHSSSVCSCIPYLSLLLPALHAPGPRILDKHAPPFISCLQVLLQKLAAAAYQNVMKPADREPRRQAVEGPCGIPSKTPRSLAPSDLLSHYLQQQVSAGFARGLLPPGVASVTQAGRKRRRVKGKGQAT